MMNQSRNTNVSCSSWAAKTASSARDVGHQSSARPKWPAKIKTIKEAGCGSGAWCSAAGTCGAAEMALRAAWIALRPTIWDAGTVMNALALQDALERRHRHARADGY